MSQKLSGFFADFGAPSSDSTRVEAARPGSAGEEGGGWSFSIVEDGLGEARGAEVMACASG